MTATFDALGVSPDLVRALARDGFTTPFPVQSLTIPDALAGVDVCGKARTGSGKTLAFGLPMLQRVGRAQSRRPLGLVLVPTRELAKQVHEVLEPLAAELDVRLAAVYGGAPLAKQASALKSGVEIVVATPGRVIDLIEQKLLSVAAVEIVTVDEADRMNDMGFRPQVEWILRRIEGRHQTLLFSATLDGAVGSLIRRFMHDPVHYEVDEAPAIEAMTHRFLAVHQMDKPKLAAALIDAHERALIFVRTKRGADRLVRQLVREGVHAEAIHGDRAQSHRERALSRFAGGKLGALVATDVAARGIDVEGVDVVIHFDPPEDPKAYTHRSGRTARAGETGLVVTLSLWDQHLAVEALQRQLGLSEPIIEMFSNDPRLADLAGWNPADEEAA